MSKGQAYIIHPLKHAAHIRAKIKVHNATISLDLSLWVDPVQRLQAHSFTIQAA